METTGRAGGGQVGGRTAGKDRAGYSVTRAQELELRGPDFPCFAGEQRLLLVFPRAFLQAPPARAAPESLTACRDVCNLKRQPPEGEAASAPTPVLPTATSVPDGNTGPWFATSLVTWLASRNLLTLGQTDKTEVLNFPHQGPKFGDCAMPRRPQAGVLTRALVLCLASLSAIQGH